jgi:Lipase (class 3)
MWLSKLIGKLYLKEEIDNYIDFTKDKYFIRKLVKNKQLDLKKNKLILCCILSAVVYRYTEPDVIKVNISKASKASEASNAVKDFNETCASWDLSSDNTSIYNIDSILVFGMFYINNTIFISFKGSSNLNDFLTDIDINQTEFKVSDNEDKINVPGKVHKGAYEMLFENYRYKVILEKINEYNGDNIYITGHSLGGLLGTIFYSYLKEKFKTKKINIKLITFGCPRVGNKTYTNSINYNSNNRIVNDNDCIAKLPLPINYSHPELLFKIGKVKTNNFWFNIKSSIDDHKIENYYKNLFLL